MDSNVKSAVIFVFSGTGNTRRAADMIADSLAKRGVGAVVEDIKRPFAPPIIEGFDVVGLGYPIHAFNTPQIFRDFVKTLPEGAGRRVFLFKTSGEPFVPNSASSKLVYEILKKKGYVPSLERHLLMPYNIMFRYRDTLVKQMYRHTRAMAELMAKYVAEERWETLCYQRKWRAFASVFRALELPFAKFNGRLYHVNKKKCTMCGRCAKNCPTGNITICDGAIKFDGQCALCMRCVMYCPQNAIHNGLLRLWRVNGGYPFEALERDDSVPANYVNPDTKGYFKLFRKYYQKTSQELWREGIVLPPDAVFADDSIEETMETAL